MALIHVKDSVPDQFAEMRERRESQCRDLPEALERDEESTRTAKIVDNKIDKVLERARGEKLKILDRCILKNS